MVKELTGYDTSMKCSLTILLLAIAVESSYGQGRYGPTPEDSARCIQRLSLFMEFEKNLELRIAYDVWKELTAICPHVRDDIFSRGRRLLNKLIDVETKPKARRHLLKELDRLYEQWKQRDGDTEEIKNSRQEDRDRYGQ